MTERTPPAVADAWSLERTVPAWRDLDWLPPSLKTLRWAIAGGVWTGLAGLLAGVALVSKGNIFIWTKGFAWLGAGGFYAGDRAARSVMRRRLHKLARGAVDLRSFAREADGEILHVRGRVRARETLPSLLGGEPVVYRRATVALGGATVVHEAAVDFALVDASGEMVTVHVAAARLLVAEPKRLRLVERAIVERVAALPLPARAARAVETWLTREAHPKKRKRLAPITASEVLLRDGDPVELVGYKSRTVDQTVATRLERDTPMRATLRGGRDLPLLIVPLPPSEAQPALAPTSTVR